MIYYGFPQYASWNNGSVLLLKTHQYGKSIEKKGYKQAVVLLRKPMDAILAEFNRRALRSLRVVKCELITVGLDVTMSCCQNGQMRNEKSHYQL